MTSRHLERIAITGFGMVTSLGRDAEATFGRVVSGDVGIAPISTDLGLPVEGFPVAAVRSCDIDEPPLRNGYLPWSRCDALAVQAAREALVHAGVGARPIDLLLGETTGTSREAVLDYARVSPHDTEPFRRRMVLEPLGVSGVRLSEALPQLASSAVVCSACSSGGLAIALGAMRLEQGALRPQLVGGTDALNALTLVGFGALGALSKQPCRPFDVARQGLNLGEGAAFLLLETESMVRARNGEVLAWLDGYALGAEAHHLAHPEADGTRASRLIADAMRRGGFSACDIGYVNAHGTATEQNDAMEVKALARIFGSNTEQLWVSSSKGQLGHSLGAAGAIEAVLVVQALRAQVVLPTMGLTTVLPDCPLSLVRGKAQSHTFGAALSSSFGFGGASAVLALASVERENRRPAEQPLTARVFVKTAVTLGACGVLLGTENVALLEDSSVKPAQRLPFEPLDRLVMERSRRFDRLTAMTALGTSLALADGRLDGANVGLVLGNALGDVSRSVEFIKRVRLRGSRGAHPAEFPHLLPSSVSGNASIYSGLQGPVFNVSDLGETMQTALALAQTCLRAGTTLGMLVGTVEALDEPVVSTLVAVETLSTETEPPSDGAAFLLLETVQLESVSDTGRCELVWAGNALDWGQGPGAKGLPTGRSEVLWASGDEAGLATDLGILGWGAVARRTVTAKVGAGWHLPGFLYAAAAARVLVDAVDAVLVVTDPPAGRHLALFLRR